MMIIQRNIDILAPYKYFNNLRILEMLLIIIEISLMLTWSANCVINNSVDIKTVPLKQLELKFT